MGYWVFPENKEQPGHDADPSPPSSATGHERVELYLYSPCGPYGLYRASVPVQGCTLPLTLSLTNYSGSPLPMHINIQELLCARQMTSNSSHRLVNQKVWILTTTKDASADYQIS